MKKILIFSHALEIGGAERALLGLLETIDTTQYDVDLFLMRHKGELLRYLPAEINLLDEIPQYACLAVPIQKVVQQGHFGMALGRLIAKIFAKYKVKTLCLPADNEVELEYSHKYTVPFVPKANNTQYDVAISFLTPHYFVTQKVNAKTKIAWIHTDYANVAVDRKSQLKMWQDYDRIVSISDNVTESFLKVFPELKEKIVLIPNILSADSIEKMSKEFPAESEMPDDGAIRLLSIGRFCTAKNFDNVPQICRRIREKGLNIKWYLIGYGNDETLIRQRIAEEHMEECVVILGKKENPYPYLKMCDIYVQPSRYEGKCVSVIEAQILHKPVIISAYSTAQSQLKDGVDGVIVPQDNEGCAEAIVRIIRDKDSCDRIVNETYRRDYTQSNALNRLYELMDAVI